MLGKVLLSVSIMGAHERLRPPYTYFNLCHPLLVNFI